MLIVQKVISRICLMELERVERLVQMDITQKQAQGFVILVIMRAPYALGMVFINVQLVKMATLCKEQIALNAQLRAMGV